MQSPLSDLFSVIKGPNSIARRKPKAMSATATATTTTAAAAAVTTTVTAAGTATPEISATSTHPNHNTDSATLANADAYADADADAELDIPYEQPLKKRRKFEPKPRKTLTLDLTQPPETIPTQSEELNLLLKTLAKKRKIVVVAGAGISVAAGIPDFRSSHGLFTTLKREHKLRGASGKQLFDASVYSTSDLTTSFHEMVRSLSTMANKAHPTLFHHLMARLAKEGRLLRLYTQNVDGIETSLPPLRTEVPLNTKAPWPRTIQLHGGLEMMICQKCRHTSPFQPELFSGPTPPLCDRCQSIESHRSSAGQRSRGVGRLRPRIVLYNESNPDEEAIGSVVTADLRAKPDALIVVGTSMKIPGVRRIVKEMGNMVRKGRKDGVAIWINRDGETGGKEFEWDLIVKGECDEVARRAAFKHWDEDDEEEVEVENDGNKSDQSRETEQFEMCTTDDINRIKREQGRLEVHIPSTATTSTLPAMVKEDMKLDLENLSPLSTLPKLPKGTTISSETHLPQPPPTALLPTVPLRTGKATTTTTTSTSRKPPRKTTTTSRARKSTTVTKSKQQQQQSIILPGHQVKPGLNSTAIPLNGRRINTTSKNAQSAQRVQQQRRSRSVSTAVSSVSAATASVADETAQVPPDTTAAAAAAAAAVPVVGDD